MVGYSIVAVAVWLLGFVGLFYTDYWDEYQYLKFYLLIAAAVWPLTLILILIGAIYLSYERGLDKRKPL